MRIIQRFPNGVTTIGDDAFSGCNSLTSLTIGDSVTSIGDYAFSRCYSLTSVTIPDSVTTIGDYAFHYCTSLTSVTIPDSVTTIGDDAFYNCRSLTSLTIGDSVTSIGDEAFYYCNSLTAINVDSGNTAYKSINGVLFNKAGTTLIKCPARKSGAYKIPNGVTTIGNVAFYYCTSLTSVTIGDSVTTIGDSAFYGCDSLTSVTIGDSVTTIGDEAFYGCDSLTSVTIPDSVTSIGGLAFHETPYQDSIADKNGFVIINGILIGYFGNGGNVAIPDSVTSIGDSAFYGCDSLTSVTIPDCVTTIGDSAFWGCHSLTSVTIPDCVTTIGDLAFYGCGSLTKVTIPDSVTSIGDEAFSACTGLTAINVDSGNAAYKSVNGVLFNKAGTILMQYPGGKSGAYKIPNGVTTIGDGVFFYCNSLTSVTIPDSVTSIGRRAFCFCASLTSVTIGDSVTSIGDEAFYGCYSLTSVTIPDSVTTIGDDAFYYCTSLTSVTIPDSVTTIGNRAFDRCKSMTSITFAGDAPAIGENCFYNVTATAYYPKDNPTWTSDVMQDYSGDITWVPYKALAITVQPKTAYAKSGEKVSTTVQAVGDGLTYQWYIKNANSNTYSKSSVTSATYSCTMNDASHGRRAYCVVTDKYGNKVTSNTVLLRRQASITTQPKTGYARQGEVAKVTVGAVGDGLTYQWYIKNANGTKYSKSSVTSATYSCTMNDASHGRRAYCVVTDKYGKTVTSNTVLLRMAATITTQPKTGYAKQGQTVKVTVGAVGDGLTYQWYIKNANSTSYGKSSVTSATYSCTMTDASHGRRAYCVVTDKYGKTVTSNTVLLRMAATITTQPKSVTVAKNSTAKVTVGAVGDGLTYTWYIKNANGTKYSKSSVTSATYSCIMTDASKGRSAYCIVTDKYGKTVQSNTVTLKMK